VNYNKKEQNMGTITLSTEDIEESTKLIREALIKEKYLLQVGIEKTLMRVQQFEEKYSVTLEQILNEEREIDHTDLAEWEGEIEVLKRLKKKIQNLEQIKICT
jgi:hypothetical protein